MLTYYSKHKTAFCHLAIYVLKSPGIYHNYDMAQKLEENLLCIATTSSTKLGFPKLRICQLYM